MGLMMADTIPEGDDDELCILRAVLDVVGDDRNIPEIKRCIDFIHKVERSRLTLGRELVKSQTFEEGRHLEDMERKDQRQ